MKKVTKTQYNALIKSSAKEAVTCSYKVNGEDIIDITITPQIGVVDRVQLVTQIINCLFVDDEYLFYMKNTIYWYYMVATFTNLPVPSMFVSKGKDSAVFNHQVLTDIYTLATNTSLGEDILEAIGSNAALINEEIEAGIEFRKAQAIQKGSAFDKMMAAAGGILDILENAVKKFDGLDPKMIEGLTKNLNGMDEQKIVDLITAKNK